jgi:hypothetical protein
VECPIESASRSDSTTCGAVPPNTSTSGSGRSPNPGPAHVDVVSATTSASGQTPPTTSAPTIDGWLEPSCADSPTRHQGGVFCPVVVLPDQATTTTDGGSPTIQQKLDRLAWKTVYPQTQPLHGRYDKVWLRCIICYS